MNFWEFVLWLAPVFIVAGGLFLSNLKKIRTLRYVFYSLVLFTAFLIDLNNVIFSNYKLNMILFLVVSLFFSEFFWKMLRSKKRILVILSVISGLLLFAFEYKDWVFTGPTHFRVLWESPVVSEYKKENEIYKLRESVKSACDKSRIFKLYKCTGFLTLEKYKDQFKVPEGYRNAQFHFRWHHKASGVSVDLIGESDTLWTLSQRIYE